MKVNKFSILKIDSIIIIIVLLPTIFGKAASKSPPDKLTIHSLHIYLLYVLKNWANGGTNT